MRAYLAQRSHGQKQPTRVVVAMQSTKRAFTCCKQCRSRLRLTPQPALAAAKQGKPIEHHPHRRCPTDPPGRPNDPRGKRSILTSSRHPSSSWVPSAPKPPMSRTPRPCGCLPRQDDALALPSLGRNRASETGFAVGHRRLGTRATCRGPHLSAFPGVGQAKLRFTIWRRCSLCRDAPSIFPQPRPRCTLTFAA